MYGTIAMTILLAVVCSDTGVAVSLATMNDYESFDTTHDTFADPSYCTLNGGQKPTRPHDV